MSEHVLVGGVERRPIEIFEHDPAWAARFTALRAPLVAALAGVAARVEHVGSTAVPELAAKQVIAEITALAERWAAASGWALPEPAT